MTSTASRVRDREARGKAIQKSRKQQAGCLGDERSIESGRLAYTQVSSVTWSVTTTQSVISQPSPAQQGSRSRPSVSLTCPLLAAAQKVHPTSPSIRGIWRRRAGREGISTSGPASRWQKPPTKPRQLGSWRLHQRLLPPSRAPARALKAAGRWAAGNGALTSPLNRWAGPIPPFTSSTTLTCDLPDLRDPPFGVDRPSPSCRHSPQGAMSRRHCLASSCQEPRPSLW